MAYTETLYQLLIDCKKYNLEGLEYISHGVYGNTVPTTHRLFEI